MKETFDGRPYDEWMQGLAEWDKHYIKHLLIAFALFGIPESMMDVGCGTGAMVKTAMKLGVRSYGLDQIVDEDDKVMWPDGFHRVNLVDYWQAPEPVDIVFSSEVAEHLHFSAHGTFCSTLCNNIKEGPNHYLIFTAARPGQVGSGHVGLRPLEEWHDEMLAHGMHFDRDATMNLALLFSNCRSPLTYFWNNLQVFNR